MCVRKSIRGIVLIVAVLFLFSPAPVAAQTGLPSPTTATTESSQQPYIEDQVPVETAPLLQSESAVLMDADSGQILFGKNMDEILYPASITKILTALVALEQGQLDDVITMTNEAVFSVERGSSHIALDVGEQISMDQALYALAIASANDAANGIAERIGGSIEQFTRLMNERAKEAGALNSHFNNANGLPDPDHVTTARDMALITRAAVNTAGWSRYFGAARYEIPPTNLMAETREMYSYNSFLNGERTIEGIVACKTGYTNEAFHTLVTVVRRNGRTLIAVVMKSELKSAKWDDTIALMDYGYSQFRQITLQPDDFPSDVVELEPQNGQTRQATLAVTLPVTIWLHQTVKVADVGRTLLRPDSDNESDLDQTAMQLTVGGQFSDRMATELMVLPIKPVIAVTSVEAAAGLDEPADTTPVQIWPIWLKILLVLFATSGVVFVGVAIYAIRLREIKRRHRRERLALLKKQFQDNQRRYY